jgi:biopolymer transport protein ExbD
MNKNRFIRFRTRRGKNADTDIDITSLLDIITILVVFLLVNFNSSGVVIDIRGDIKIPDSQSTALNNPGVIIQLSKKQLWVEDQELINFETSSPEVKLYDDGGRRIVPLFNKLSEIKDQVDVVNKHAGNDKPFSGVANLVVDKSITYDMIRKVLYTCAEAGFQKYKFVVMGEQAF